MRYTREDRTQTVRCEHCGATATVSASLEDFEGTTEAWFQPPPGWWVSRRDGLRIGLRCSSCLNFHEGRYSVHTTEESPWEVLGRALGWLRRGPAEKQQETGASGPGRNIAIEGGDPGGDGSGGAPKA